MIPLHWLRPGIGIKRWLGLGLLGITLCSLSLAAFMGLEEQAGANSLASILNATSTLDRILMFLGGVSVCAYAFFQLHGNLLSGLATMPGSKGNRGFASAYLRRRILQKGPRIVAIGGGTGLSTILTGLKEHSSNISAIVTVSDDGGSSGRLRKALGLLPPGDIRNCLVALARRGPLLSDLLQHRFEKGEGLKDHCFGNLLIAALTEITGNFLEAVKATSEVLAIAGEVLPATCQQVSLVATLEDGRTIRGESAIPRAGSRIVRVMLDPPSPYPPKEVISRISDADLVILGPGSLYTSVIPNLLVSGIADAINRTSGLVVYIANIMTQPGETDGYDLADHIHALLGTTPLTRLDAIVVNSGAIGASRLLNYERGGSRPVVLDKDFRTQFDIGVYQEDILSLDGLVRHDPRKTADCLVTLLSKASRILA